MIAGLTEPKIADVVIIHSVITDRCTYSADIADIVDIGETLKMEGMSDGATFFRAGGDSTSYTVEVLAYPAIGTTKFLIFALVADRVDHLIVGTDVKLEVVVAEAFVLVPESL